VLEPNELSTTVFSIAAGCQEVQAAITIDIDPLTGMVEVATLESGDLVIHPFATFLNHDKNVAVAFARGQEAVGYNDGINSSAKDILRDDTNVVGPFELIRENLSLQCAKVLGCNSVPNLGDNGDLTAGECAELGDQQHFWLIGELLHRDECWRRSLNGAKVSVGDIGG
jgi:hypothetical protein